MSTVLTVQAADRLLHTGHAIRQGDTLITRTRFYLWDAVQRRYLLTHDGLRVVHQCGWRWDMQRQRFTVCRCAHCSR